MLSELLSSEERIRLLRYVLTTSPVTVTGAARGAGVNKGLASRYLALLVEEGYLERVGRDFCTVDGPKTRSLNTFLNIEALEKLVDLPDWAIGIGLYGSWSTGTNTSESDLDLWLLVDEIGPETDLEVARLDRDLSGAIGCEVTIQVLTRDKLAALREEDLPFYIRRFALTV
ncbi:helix-turn-helix domain-containing protein [Candidatus Methanocrinis natronophilus]|uniref:Helix-turn-helix domain-containing protein n=1 Tax=Candidatus Methanocrinis natronophilus TaxID=3033396 RepID=A0ABT5X831_9EURY|nr:helix-turn-helix domain-containing protein [Candidatus Methanocrinis natronophilus]MDF0590859.1 helix-turn-helix domain-containing protein [Candidatus Methanocrinis natronophilus]